VQVAPKNLNVEMRMRMSFFATCPWPRPGMQGLSSMDSTAALLPFPYNAPAKSRQGGPLTGGLSVPRKSGPASALPIGHETKKDIRMLYIVSLMYNPEAKCRGHLLKSQYE
jgi:hypothetical protein